VTHGASDVSRRVRGDIHELVKLRAPGGLENLKLVDEDHPKPGPGETDDTKDDENSNQNRKAKTT
jgi:hypothetical protein